MRLQLKIDLNLFGLPLPPVWRRILIPANWDFEQLNDVIQTAMGWEFAHIWLFKNKEQRPSEIIAMDDEGFGFGDPPKVAAEVLVSERFKHRGDPYFYTYDTGDSWEHCIVLEGFDESDAEEAALLDGEGACPPEDCGGPPGYAEMVQIAADPAYPDPNEFREWLGLDKNEVRDLTRFDLKEAQDRVANLGYLYEDSDGEA